MAASFAAYASQYLNKAPADSKLGASQPLFYSFETDGDKLDMSEPRRTGGMDLEDEDDPHLRASGATSRGNPGAQSQSYPEYPDMDDEEYEEEDADPYLRLDEEERNIGSSSSRYNPQTQALLSGSRDNEGSKGWLAHQAMRSPSPSPSSMASSSEDEDAGIPPGSLFSSRRSNRGPPHTAPHAVPPPPQTGIAFSLTESLLPRDGHSRPIDVFSLPDPRHIPRGRRRYNDSQWIAAWLTGLGLCFLFSIITLFIIHRPEKKPNQQPLPYITLLHTVPLLTILTMVSATTAYAHLFLLRIFVKPIMIATSVFVPVTLFISSVWAFVGSFMWDGDLVPTWGETVGLRLFAIVPLILSLLTARRLLDLPHDLHTTSSLLDLTARVLLSNPYLLALSPAILLTALVASIPFLTLIFRLLLIGHFDPVKNGLVSWHVQAWANWIIALVATVWLWSWGVARGVLRVSVAAVVGAWYFADQDLPPPPPGSTHVLHAAVMRSTETSLGSVVLSAMILTGLRLLSLSSRFFTWLPLAAPLASRPYVTPVSMALVYVMNWLENKVHARTMSAHALVYVGLTGNTFMPSARRARTLTSKVEDEGTNIGVGKYKRKFKTEPPLTLLTVTPLTLTLPFALSTYLFVAHTLNAPDSALGAAILAGGVTALVGLFCVGLVKDTSDTLYLCYCIDKELHEQHRKEVFEALEYEYKQPSRPPPPPVSAPKGPMDRSTLPPPVTQSDSPSQSQSRRGEMPLMNQPLPEYPEYSPPSSRSASPEPASYLQHAPVSPPAHVYSSTDASGYSVEDSRESRVPGELPLTSTAGLGASQSQSRRLDEDEEDEGSRLFPGSDLF